MQPSAARPQSDIANRIFIDLLNEPDSIGLNWNGGNGKPAVSDLFLGAMDAMWALTPGKMVFFVEGSGQVNFPGMAWGNGAHPFPSLATGLAWHVMLCSTA